MAIKLDHQLNKIITQGDILNVDIIGALNLPTGTTGNRPGAPTSGDIRFNSTTSRFEGYNGTNWKTFTTLVQDIDLDTYIQVEDSDGADNDQIDFYTANTQRMVIHSDGNIGIGVAVPVRLLDVGGTIRATGAATFDDTLYAGGIADFDARVDINDSTVSSNSSSGALVVAGGAGIGGALNVGGDMNVDGTVTMTGNFQVSGTQTQLVSTSINQALIKLGEGNTTQTVDQGFIVTRGNGTTNTNNVGAIWDESEDEVALISCPTEDGATNGNVVIADYIKMHVGALEAEDNLTVKGLTALTGALTSQARGTFTELEVGDLGNQKIVFAGPSGRVETSSDLSFDGTNMVINTTGVLQLPGGSNAQRPGVPAVGMVRYNTNTNEFEGYINGAWTNFTTTTFVELSDGPGDFDSLKFLRANSAGNALEWSVPVTELVNDTTPQLGGNLDLNGNNITGTGNISLTSISADASDGPELSLDRNSASPVAGDSIGVLKFKGRSGAGATISYAKQTGRIVDESNGAEKGSLQTSIRYNGSDVLITEVDNDGLRIAKGGLIFEGTSDDTNETTLTVTNPGQDNTITLPDASGTVMLNVVEDTTPQLGGALDLNDKNITLTTMGGSDIGTASKQLGTLYTNNIHMHNAYHSHASTTTTSSTSIATVDQWPIATYRSAKYFISCENTTSSKYHITQIMVLHNGTDVYQTTYGTLISNELQYTISADIDAGNLRLRLTPASGDTMNYRFIAEKHLI
tara:strand:- start:848 stop:3082 length:2235 start_codon:yes stop_codon:yes gene_type:complete